MLFVWGQLENVYNIVFYSTITYIKLFWLKKLKFMSEKISIMVILKYKQH